MRAHDSYPSEIGLYCTLQGGVLQRLRVAKSLWRRTGGTAVAGEADDDCAGMPTSPS